jgi:hypothetical protein
MTSSLALFKTFHSIAFDSRDIGREFQRDETWPMDVEFSICKNKIDTPNEYSHPECQECFEGKMGVYG